MLSFVRGDLFESPAKVLVNTVNTVGAMGKGIALKFKQIYPEMYKEYVTLCESGKFDVGKLWLYKTQHKWVLNFPTKKNWRNSSKLEYIEAGLEKFVATYAEQGITSVAFPELGCGNGDLDWNVVRPVMLRHLKNLPINVYIYLYGRGSTETPEHRDISVTKKWLRSEAKLLAFEEVWSDLAERVGTGLRLRVPDSSEDFSVQLVRYDDDGLMIYPRNRGVFQKISDYFVDQVNTIGSKWRIASDRGIYIPKNSLLDLWQSIRTYGFCFRRMMPDGLDLLSEYLIPLLAELPYMKRIQMGSMADDVAGAGEAALQLCVTHSSDVTVTRQLELIPA